MLATLAMLIVGGGGCRTRRVVTRPEAAVETALRPDRFAANIHRLGRAHFRGVARLAAGPENESLESITTETDLWLDDRGNWRLVELNDKDGGREIVLHGRELSVALRYGKMIRRPAEDPEPQHLLEEGIGAPFAAWDLLRNIRTVDDFGGETRAGRPVHVYKVTRSPGPDRLASPVDAGVRRAWRQTLVASEVTGTIVIDDTTGTPLQADFRGQYQMRRPGGGSGGGRIASAGPDAPGSSTPRDSSEDEGGVSMRGSLDIHTSIEEIGQSPEIARPEAEDLPQRQRTIPDEKALLGGLPRSAPHPTSE